MLYDPGPRRENKDDILSCSRKYNYVNQSNSNVNMVVHFVCLVTIRMKNLQNEITTHDLSYMF